MFSGYHLRDTTMTKPKPQAMGSYGNGWPSPIEAIFLVIKLDKIGIDIMKYRVWNSILEYEIVFYSMKYSIITIIYKQTEQICWNRNKTPEHPQTQKNSLYLDALKITGCIFCRFSSINFHQHALNQQEVTSKKWYIVVFWLQYPLVI